MPADDQPVRPDPARDVHEGETVIPARGADFDAMPGQEDSGPGSGGVATLTEFSDSLVEIGLIDAGDLEGFAPDSSEGVLGLSRALVKAGKLTPYQAAAVYQKKSRGLLIGNYLILEKLGQGGMGVVFKARHRRLGRVGALKILPPSFARDRNAVMRFRREVEAAGRLKHPNLVAAQDADEDRGVHFLVMDYVEGRDLDHVVRERGPLPVAQAVDCLIQAARGLEAAHAEGIIHRDIKPANLMLESAGTVRVLDLGLARIVDAANPFSKTTGGRLTESGMYMGTIDYMAPEQAEDSHRVDHRADIYSLGCTLYYLLTGGEPFPGETVLKRLLAHMERPAPSLRTARPGVSTALEAAYQKMVAKRPDDRPASMTEVIALLEACKGATTEASAAAGEAPKSRPELMVFNEAPLKRAGAPKTKAEPSIFARRDEPGGLRFDTELRLEDLVMDVRPDVRPKPLPATPNPAVPKATPPKRPAPTRPPGQPLRYGLVLVGLGVAAVLGATFVRSVFFPSPVPRSETRSPIAAIHPEKGNDRPETPPSPPPKEEAGPAIHSTGDIVADTRLPSFSKPAVPKPKAPEPKAPEPKAPEPKAPEPQWAMLRGRHHYDTRGMPDEAPKTLGDLATQDQELKSIAFTPSGGWAILWGRNGARVRNIPDEAVKTLDNLAKRREELKSITFSPGGGWTILFGLYGNVSQNIPGGALQTLADLTKRRVELKSVAFAPSGGWAILFGRHGYAARNIPDEAIKALGDLAKRGENLRSITFTPDGGWAILFGWNGNLVSRIPGEAYRTLIDMGKMRSEEELKCLSFPVPAIVRLSQDDRDTRNWVLERMAQFKVPGLSIALVNNFQVEWARGYGVARTEGSEPVTPETRFQAASISKPVTALAALRLVQQGKLDLNQALNEKLVSWKVPDNEFTRRRKPTLRQVLAHSAGFLVKDFDGYKAGDRLPTLIQMLNGTKPANSPSIRVEFVPGRWFQYSDGGYLVLQQMIMDVTGKPFSAAMQELVLDPLAMKQSRFQQPPSPELEAVAAEGHANGAALPGRWHIYPELAAAGLWTTPSDLARFVIAIQQAKKGSRDAILSPRMVGEMLTKQTGDVGLGVFLAGTGNSLEFNHSGGNAGFECFLVGFTDTGQGAVLMTNANGGLELIKKLVENLRAEYVWPG